MRLPRLLAVLALAAVLSACSIPGGGTGTPPSPAPTRDNGASAAGIDPARPPAAVGSVAAACAPGGPFARVTIGVLEVKRQGQLATATFVATAERNPSFVPDEKRPTPYSLFACNGGVWDPQLVDGANLVSYTPIKLAVAHYLRSDPVNTAIDASPTYLYAVFPAPKAGVKTVDVVVGAGVVPGVTVS